MSPRGNEQGHLVKKCAVEGFQVTRVREGQVLATGPALRLQPRPVAVSSQGCNITTRPTRRNPDVVQRAAFGKTALE